MLLAPRLNARESTLLGLCIGRKAFSRAMRGTRVSEESTVSVLWPFKLSDLGVRRREARLRLGGGDIESGLGRDNIDVDMKL